MNIFIADQRVKNRRDTRGSLVFFESTKIKRTTLSTTVAELYALMKCFGTCQMLRGLWKDISGLDAEIHMRPWRGMPWGTVLYDHAGPDFLGELRTPFVQVAEQSRTAKSPEECFLDRPPG